MFASFGDWLFDFIFPVAMCSGALNFSGSASLRNGAAKVRDMVNNLQFTFDPGGIFIGLENQAIGLHFQNLDHLKNLHQQTCNFKGYVSSFFSTQLWSPAYGSKFSSNDVHAIIIPLLVEERALHLLHNQLDNCWYMLSINEVERCLLAMKLSYLFVVLS